MGKFPDMVADLYPAVRQTGSFVLGKKLNCYNLQG